MKGGRLGVLIVLLIFFSSLSFGLINSNDGLGVNESNLARIFDFDNDGRYELLAFSDKIDSRERPIDYYDVSGETFTKTQQISSNLQRCSLSYQDYNLDGNIDIFYSCFNDSSNFSSLENKLYSFNGSKFQPQSIDFDHTSLNLADTAYGDTLFFDFNNDSYADILSCFITDGDNIQLFDGASNFSTITNSGIKLSDFLNLSNPITNCYLTQADFDGDNDLDVIAYTYDANDFTLYENIDGVFNKSTDDTLFNQTFFSENKIKALKASDENQDGFSDLYYIVDTGAIGDNRGIEFGYFLNQHRGQSDKNLATPSITKFDYVFKNSDLFNFSWWNNYTQEENYYEIEVQGNGISHNINITDSEYVYGDLFVNNYDYNSGFGNLLYRKEINLSIPNRCYNVSAQTFLASGKMSSSLVRNYSSTEVCDGYDNDCDGLIDEGYDVTLPNGTVVTGSFDRDSDGYSPNLIIDKYSNGTHNWTVKFDCSLRNAIIGLDSNDNSASICPTCESDVVINSGKNLGGTSIYVAPVEEEVDTNVVDNTDGEVFETVIKESDQTSSDKTVEKILQSLTEDRLRHKTVVQYTNGKTKVIESIKNLDLYSVNNVSFIVNIPKEIAMDVEEITEVTKFNIIERDPIIEFDLNEIQSYGEKTIQYIFNKKVSEEELSNIKYTIDSSATDKDTEKEINFQIEKTKQVLEVDSSSRQEDNKTILTLDVNLDELATLENVSIYQEIPKCLIEEINDQVAESELAFEIIEEDPLIVWHFDKLIDSQKIELAIDSLADENCTNLVKTVSLAKQIIVNDSEINHLNVLLASLLIPFFAILLIVIGEFSKHNDHENEIINKLIKKVKYYYHHGLREKDIILKLKQQGFKTKEVTEAITLNAKTKLHFWHQKWNVGMHELVLLILVFLNILDFSELGSFLNKEKSIFIIQALGDVDYFKKIISWVILGYLLYRVSITGIIIGKKIFWADVALIFSFFLLTLKNLVGFAKVAIWESYLVQDLYAFIWRHNNIFETYAFILGLVGIILITIYLARQEARNPSVAGSFIKNQNFTKRFFIIHLALLTFFIAVFNLMFEWLAIAVDAFILIVTLGVMIYIIIKHGKKLKANDVLEEVSEDSEKIYEKVISLFHYKKFLPLAFSGMLILYVLTEIANFVVPYLTGIHDIIYFGNFDKAHLPLFSLKHFFNPDMSLFAFQAAGLTILEQILVAVVYIFNIIAILYLLFLPARIWYNYFKQKNKPIAEVKPFIFRAGEVGLFFSSLIIFFAKPVFEIVPLRTYDVIGGDKTLVGVDILTKAISLSNVAELLLVAIISGFLIGLISHKIEKATTDIVLLFSGAFFTYYAYLFFITQKDYYFELVNSLFGVNVLAFISQNSHLLFLFLVLLILFGIIILSSKYREGFYNLVLTLSLIIFTYFVYLLTKVEIINLINAVSIISPFIGIYMIFFAILSFIFIYGLGYITMFYLYMPLPIQHSFASKYLDHQNLHHIEHKSSHLNHHERAVEYIKKSIASGHELYMVVEHLEEKGWSIEDIEAAVHESVDDEKLWQGFDHFKHYHHNKHIIHALQSYINEEYYKKKRLLSDIIKELSDVKFTIDDVVYALHKTAPKGSRRANKHYKEMGDVLDLHYKQLDEVIIEAEKNGADFNHLHKSFKFVKREDGAKLAENIANALVHKHEKISELIDTLKKFKLTEDDIRVALRNIKPRNKLDEEIIKYL